MERNMSRSSFSDSCPRRCWKYGQPWKVTHWKEGPRKGRLFFLLVFLEQVADRFLGQFIEPAIFVHG